MGQTLSGSASLGGCAIDNQTTIAAVSFTVYGAYNTVASYGAYRPDVCTVTGQHPGCPNVGWNAIFDTTQVSNGPHTLAVAAVTSDGRSSISYTESTTSNGASGTVYEIVNKLSGKVLDVPGGTPNNGAIIQQWDFNGGGQQKWLLVPVDSTYYKLVNQLTGKVLDITGMSTSNGALIQQYDYWGGDNQK